MVAVYEAFAAGAFLLLEGALVKARVRVSHELGAFEAEFTMRAVMCFAVDVHHSVDGFLLSSNPGMFSSGHMCLTFSIIRTRQAESHKGLPEQIRDSEKKETNPPAPKKL